MSQKLNLHRSGGLYLPTEAGRPQAQPDDAPLAVDMLLQCHQRVAAQCNTLQRLSVYLLDNAVDEQARQAAAGVMRYFDVAAPLHHADEEQDWWELLHPVWAQDATRLALLDRLRGEHRLLESRWQGLRAQLQDVVHAGPDETRCVSQAAVNDFVTAYEAHIALEEGPWLRAARQSVSEEDLARLGASMTARRRQT
jgi:hemerythrin-like domain-containing protein